MVLLDGKACAADIKTKIHDYINEHDLDVSLAVIQVGNDPASSAITCRRMFPRVSSSTSSKCSTMPTRSVASLSSYRCPSISMLTESLRPLTPQRMWMASIPSMLADE